MISERVKNELFEVFNDLLPVICATRIPGRVCGWFEFAELSVSFRSSHRLAATVGIDVSMPIPGLATVWSFFSGWVMTCRYVRFDRYRFIQVASSYAIERMNRGEPVLVSTIR